MEKNHLNQLLSLCLSEEESKEKVESSFSLLSEQLLHDKILEEQEFIVYFKAIVENLAPTWSLSTNIESKVDLLSSLFTFMKDAIQLHPSIEVIEISMMIFASFIQDDTKPNILKTVISTLTTIYPFVIHFISNIPSSLQNKSHQSFILYNQLERIRDKILLFLMKSDNDGVKNAVIKWTHTLILIYSYAPKDSMTIGLEGLSENHLFFKRDDLALLGRQYLDKLLSSCHSDSMTSGNITAIINLLIPLLKARPQFIPHVLPVLLELFDNPPNQFSEHQTKSIFHTLKLQLTNLSKLPIANEFAPMIQQLLSEMNFKSKSLKKEKSESEKQPSQLESKKQKLDTSVPIETPSNVIKKPTKYAAISHDRKLPFDLNKIPLNWLVDIIVGSLLSCSVTDINLSVRTLYGESIEIDEEFETKMQISIDSSKDTTILSKPDDEEETKSINFAKDINAIINEQQILSSKESHDLIQLIYNRLLNFLENINSHSDTYVLWSDFITKFTLLLESQSNKDEPFEEALKTIPIHEENNNDSNKQRFTHFGKFSNSLLTMIFSEGISASLRLYLTLIYLYREWKNQVEIDNSLSSSRLFALYSVMLKEFSSHFLVATNRNALSISKFISLSPVYSEEGVKEGLLNMILEEEPLIEDENKIEGIISVVQNLLFVRPITRTSILPLLLQTFVSPNEKIRRTSISTCKNKLLGINCIPSLLNVIIEFASFNMLNIQKDDQMNNDLMEPEEDGEEEKEKEKKIGGGEGEGGEIYSEKVSFNNVARYSDLFLTICESFPNLLLELFPIYNGVHSIIQKHIRTILDPHIRLLFETKENELLDIFKQLTPGCEHLFLRILTMITKTSTLNSSLILTVKDVVDKLNLDGRYLVPILHGMEKNDIIGYLPKFISLLTGKPKENTLVREIFVRIMSPLTKGNISPIELVVSIHTLESKIERKKAMEALQICFSMPEIFKQEVLAASLQQLVDKNPIPNLFMRTAIQSLNLYRSLSGFMSTLLFRLVSKKIWLNKNLWEGFIKCCQIMQPTSLQILIQLPLAQLNQLLEIHPEMKPALKTFLQQQPPSLRLRFNNLLTLLEGN